MRYSFSPETGQGCPCGATEDTLSNRYLFVAICDSASVKIVRRKLDRHTIARENLDVVHAHLARDMGQNLMTILELDLEHSIGKRLDYRALKLNRIFFAQLSAALS